MRMIRVLKLQKLVEHLAEIGAFASLVGRLGSIAFWVLVRGCRSCSPRCSTSPSSLTCGWWM